MATPSPAHPGRHLQSVIEARELTVAETAHALGVTTHQLHDVISGNVVLSPEMAMRLEIVIGSTAESWLKMQSDFALGRIRHKKPELAKRLRKLRSA